ncbi:helix-turn-helix domain-containing protein [Pseudorhodoplanes sp.]|uniref:helix-turn-helix domain-containing protein n=1 Tax=Pseudorhodoplanes sp. TaxID=1934341 RepID=UPI00391AAC2D
MATTTSTFGTHLRAWRQRRRMSQLALALDAEISARHLSFVETGKAQPSREMVLRLAERLDVPLRDRNMLLSAAGFAPVFPERKLDDPAMQNARRAVDRVLKGHEPYPALAIDRHWTMLAANAAVAPLLAGAAAALLAPPLNVLRLSLHPDGLSGRILNLAQWRAHLLERLRRQIEITADPVLVLLLKELEGYPAPRPPGPIAKPDHADVIVPLRLRIGDDTVLSLISTTTVFGTPQDITLSELALETFFPADAVTAEILRGMAVRAP